MTKYEIPDDHWQDDEPEGPPAWKEDTSADVEFDVTLHEQGYQNNRKWTVHTMRHEDEELVAAFAVEHQNKGNYWREGDIKQDAVDFVDLPLPVRKRASHVLNRSLEAITPERKVVEAEE